MEIEIKIGGLDSLAAAVKEAAACNLKAARLQAESRAAVLKGISDALTILLPATISGRSPAHAFESDAPEAEQPAPAVDARQSDLAAESDPTPAEAANPVAITAENTPIEDAKDENPVNARGSREARQVAESEAAEKPPFEETPAAKPEQKPAVQGGAAAEAPKAVTMSDVMAICEGLKKDFPAIFTRQYAREFAKAAFSAAGLESTPKTDAEVARLFEIVSLKDREFREANHG